MMTSKSILLTLTFGSVLLNGVVDAYSTDIVSLISHFVGRKRILNKDDFTQSPRLVIKIGRFLAGKWM
jgi:hypothetical protein